MFNPFKNKEERPPIIIGGCEVPPPTRPCGECGGYFRQGKLKAVFRGESILFGGTVGIPFFEEVYYCQRCVPKSGIVFILRDRQGDVLDEHHFSVSDGWLQTVDGDTGEDQFTVTLDAYQRAFCSECGEPTEEALCKNCTPVSAPKPKARKSTLKGRTS